MSSVSLTFGGPGGFNFSHKSETFELSFGKYTVIKALGQGVSGKVYLVEDESGQQFALKAFHTKHNSEESLKKAQERANHEAIVLKMRYPGLIETDIADDKQYIRMPYLGDDTLFSKYTSQGLSTLGSASKHTLFSGFAHLVQDYVKVYDLGLLHLDIKPANIMVNEGKFCLTDFGVAVRVGEEAWPDGMKVTTRRYKPFEDRWRAPEGGPVKDPKPNNPDFYRHWPRTQSHGVNTDMYGLAVSMLETYGLNMRKIERYIKASKSRAKSILFLGEKKRYRDDVATGIEKGIHRFIDENLETVLPQELVVCDQHFDAFKGFLKFLTVSRNSDRMSIDQFKQFVVYFTNLSRAIDEGSDLNAIGIPGMGENKYDLPKEDTVVASKRPRTMPDDEPAVTPGNLAMAILRAMKKRELGGFGSQALFSGHSSAFSKV